MSLKLLFNGSIISDAENKKDNVDAEFENDTYIPPYLKLMHKAIKHFKITDYNQPLLDTLIEWFKTHEIGGKKISENEAKKLASFVRLPSFQKGGNRAFEKDRQK